MGATVLPTEQARTLAFVRHADGDTALGLDGAKRPTSGLPSEQAPDSPRAALDALPRRRRWLKVQVVNTPPPQNPLRPVTGEITVGPDMLRDLRQILRCLFPSSGVNARPALAAGFGILAFSLDAATSASAAIGWTQVPWNGWGSLVVKASVCFAENSGMPNSKEFN